MIGLIDYSVLNFFFCLKASNVIKIYKCFKLKITDFMKEIPKKYEESHAYFSLAGSGDPWSYLTKIRKNILRALHDRLSTEEIASTYNLSLDDLMNEIEPLIESTLVQKIRNNFAPTFLITNHEETKIVFNHSKEMGRKLADILILNWGEIEQVFEQLEISQKHSFAEQSFLLVGSRMLDIGLLEELVKDGNILKPAPLRPSPNRPNARYYFFLIEGKLEHLGKYGQNDFDLPWSDWHIYNFGQSWIGEQRNESRDEIEKKYEENMQLNKARTPKDFASQLNIPFLNKEESEEWSRITNKMSKLLFSKIKEEEENLNSLFQSLEASKYTNNSFGEFICWYIHIAYSWAIDFLIEKNLVSLPSEYYSELVMYKEGSEGLLVNT